METGPLRVFVTYGQDRKQRDLLKIITRIGDLQIFGVYDQTREKESCFFSFKTDENTIQALKAIALEGWTGAVEAPPSWLTENQRPSLDTNSASQLPTPSDQSGAKNKKEETPCLSSLEEHLPRLSLEPTGTVKRAKTRKTKKDAIMENPTNNPAKFRRIIFFQVPLRNRPKEDSLNLLKSGHTKAYMEAHDRIQDCQYIHRDGVVAFLRVTYENPEDAAKVVAKRHPRYQPRWNRIYEL